MRQRKSMRDNGQGQQQSDRAMETGGGCGQMGSGNQCGRSRGMCGGRQQGNGKGQGSRGNGR